MQGQGVVANIQANTVVVFGPEQGVFVYSGTPAAGNPPIAWMTSSATDPYGNSIPSVGVGSNGGPGLWVSLDGGAVLLNNGSTVAGSVAASGSASLNITSPKGTALDNVAVVQLESSSLTGGSIGQVNITDAALVSTAGTAATPTNITTDTWHSITAFSNGWGVGTGYCRYRLQPNGQYTLQANLTVIGTLTSGTTMFSVPVAPAVIQFLTANTGGGTAITNVSHVQITTGGNVQTGSFPTAPTSIQINGDYSID